MENMLDILDTSAPQNKHCQFFVVRKKRYCRMLVKECENFCCEHQPINKSNDSVDSVDKMRIPCPFDSKHTCYVNKLNKHIKICNARPKKCESYIEKGVNSGFCQEIDEENWEENPKISLPSKPTSDIIRVIDQINRIYNEKQIEITEKIGHYEEIENEMKDPIYGDKTKKHLKQVSSVLGLLSEYDLLNNEACFIEFGAGRGALSYWISKATSDETSIILIEKASPKHKKDNKLDKTSGKVQRIRADIGDLVLDKLDHVVQSKYIVGVTKHLCGAATDFTIRCLTNSSKNKHKLLGFLLTFCCHHRCTWSSYTGRKYFEDLGLLQNDFNIMCGLVSWATCGTGLSRERTEKIAKKSDIKLEVKEENYNGLTPQEKEEIGLKCKNLMNWGRLKFINDAGFNANLHYYVKSDITPENVCIVARNKNI